MVQKDDFANLAKMTTEEIPLIGFSDIDRDGMPDMVFFTDSSLHVFYNKFEANGVYESNLCKQAYETKSLIDNEFFSKFSQVGIDTHVSNFFP